MIKSKLRVLLALNEMNQSELASKTGVRPQTITNIVNNKIRQIPVDALNSICEVLGCDVGDIFGYVEDEEPKTTNNAPQAEISQEKEKQEEFTDRLNKEALEALFKQYGTEARNDLNTQMKIMDKFGTEGFKQYLEYLETLPTE